MPTKSPHQRAVLRAATHPHYFRFNSVSTTQLELTETPDPDATNSPAHLLTYYLEIQCIDNGTSLNGGQKTGTATVTVAMQPINEHTPTDAGGWTNTATIFENAAGGTVLFSVNNEFILLSNPQILILLLNNKGLAFYF